MKIMKNRLFLIAIGLITLLGCKKDKVPAFDQVTYAKISILESQFTTGAINVADASGDLLKPGAIILYKTTGGSLGKMILKASVSAHPERKLVFDLVNYDNTGKVLFSKQGVTLPLGQVCDLDTGTSIGSGLDMSLYWVDANPAFAINVQNSATFYVYSIQ